MSSLQLIVTQDDWDLVQEVIQRSPGECSWLGVGTHENGIGTVTRIHFPDQENTSASSDIDEAALADVCLDLDPDIGETVIWWGHSHGSMNTFFSGTDWATWENWTCAKNMPFFVATVHNKKEEDPFEIVHWHGQSFPNQTGILCPEEEIDEDFDKRVKEAMENFSAPKWNGYPAVTPYGSRVPAAPVGVGVNQFGWDDYDDEIEELAKEKSASSKGLQTKRDPATGQWLTTPF